MTIGETLKQLRLDFNLTQKQIGAQCLMSDSQIRRYENGYSIPKASTLQGIVEALLDLVSNPDHPDINLFFFYCIEFNKNGKKSILRNCGSDDLTNLTKKIYYFDINKNKVTIITHDNTEDLNQLKKKIQKSEHDYRRNLTEKIYESYIENQNKISDENFLYIIQKLNNNGKQKAIDYIDDLVQIDKYKK